MTDSFSEQPPATQDLNRSFDVAAAAALPFGARWDAYRHIAGTGGAEAPALLAQALAAEKDSGLRYMTASLLREAGIATPEAGVTAAAAIALALKTEADAYARRSMELSLAALAGAQERALPLAAAAIADSIQKTPDVMTRCLQARQLGTFCEAAPAVRSQVLPAVAEVFAAEKSPVASHHLARTLAVIADDDALRPQVIGLLMYALATPHSAAAPVEKTFAAAYALHHIGATAPQEVSLAMARTLLRAGQGDTARRLCILGLGAFAEADGESAKTAAKALVRALERETEPLYRRYIVDGLMNAANNGVNNQSVGHALYLHLSARERDRETRDKITRTLRSLGHKTPTVQMNTTRPHKK
jgi:hypothetical protein